MDISNIGNSILSWITEKASFLINFLPRSPFRKVIDLMGNIPYIDAIGWFIPIDEIILLLMYWTTAIALFYAYMIVLRWVKAIE